MDVSFFGEMAWKSALISGAALALAHVRQLSRRLSRTLRIPAHGKKPVSARSGE